ncbi:nicotinate-nicotinamide nucleotide adenylyltransferase [Vibrio sp. S4M6]|uniref:nicotinate-nicotinamide nucleotide adenylyltransferase n=1 Tax=Vibrio sinus TaxID=2946865 RepID=UPI002029D68A|nr:nicotinate-nicotinamide nucleotide adenylyltransferase [Vibrio sinus]MCL9780090.1 nicotinate-nicotinamide nucleotide adenylyltransferase [Vibrio sinus]
MNKIAVFGSAFNPPSLGHKSVIESLSHFDTILLIPSICHAWGKHMADFELRCKLVEAFIRDLNLLNLELSRIEESLYKPGESVTTFDVLENLQKIYRTDDITFVIGPDNFVKFNQFCKADEIMTRWSVLACPEKLAVRSTLIREKLSKKENVDAFTTSGVARLLSELDVY